MSLETRVISLAQAIGADIKTLRTAQGDLASLSTTAKSNLVAAINEALSVAQAAQGSASTLINDGPMASGSTVWSSQKSVAELLALRVALETSIGSTAADLRAEAGAESAALRDEIVASAQAVKAEILGGAADALNTLNELAAALGNDANFAASVASSLANRVRVDAAQTFTSAEQAMGRSNIGAAAAADLSALSTAVGNTDADFVAAYNLAKA